MKILLTGANGYIGRRLKHRLLQDDNIDLRLFVRNKKSLNLKKYSNLEVVEGDTMNMQSLDNALKDVHTAYYLIHSLAKDNYRELDKISAKNFLESAIKNGVKRIIYLGGLGSKESASTHLISRIETGEILSSRPNEINTIWFRAGVIIGSGSASFEIIRNLTQKLPIMITPKWVETMAQPIGVDDVINYLSQAKDIELKENKIVDIGSEKLKYREMMLGCAEVMGLKRTIIKVPLLTPKLSSYWLTLFTPVPYSVSSSLIEGLKSEVTKQNDEATKLFPNINPQSYKESVKKALKEIEENQIISRWSDGSGDVWEKDHTIDIANAIFIHREEIDIKDYDKDKIYKSFITIGGKNGWFKYDFLWKIRGVIDKIFGGYGINRGRRDQLDLRIGDSIDFWKVIDLVEGKRLLLYAQMKLPGKAYLEFIIENEKLIQSAYFYPNGILGRIYWYILIPIHNLIFKNMILEILKKGEK